MWDDYSLFNNTGEGAEEYFTAKLYTVLILRHF